MRSLPAQYFLSGIPVILYDNVLSHMTMLIKYFVVNIHVHAISPIDVTIWTPPDIDCAYQVMLHLSN